ncbi:cytochrome P460 family protein [Pseudomonas lalucatii]|uniref:Cytochrome P460 family protein n=1 Tax=Pseudomonas lalucatii TaxID=1424203 RepID=A0ABS5Q0L3_9PSED|nr:cytochrome P460 family protein [Pseudomonas lalucatii]MBS7662104.1 cytochrome P460 family protein [Pseudomonas lalucatii]MBS7726105.1 cytochrome P460 family protein [Pseudomonas lalucatii]
MKPLASFALVLASLPLQAADLAEHTFSTYVNAKGEIRLPADARKSWSHLGSWVVADPKSPGYGFHDVYTQAETVEAYRKTGEFPDGAVLIKEIRAVEQGPQTTGQAQWAGDANVWFVMVKDRQGRFEGNPHWAEGWGWALYEAKNPAVNVSKGFAETCRGCHVPAQQSDWVFSQGYPTLARP